MKALQVGFRQQPEGGVVQDFNFIGFILKELGNACPCSVVMRSFEGESSLFGRTRGLCSLLLFVSGTVLLVGGSLNLREVPGLDEVKHNLLLK